MKAIIENKATNQNEFLRVLNIVLSCTNETELRSKTNDIEKNGFICGFGSSHFWVVESENRIIFVEL